MLKKLIVLLGCLCLLLTICGCTGVKSHPPAKNSVPFSLVKDNKTYEAEKAADKSILDTQIGEVKKITTKEPLNKDFWYSDSLSEGDKVYKCKEKDIAQTVIVEHKGTFLRMILKNDNK